MILPVEWKCRRQTWKRALSSTHNLAFLFFTSCSAAPFFRTDNSFAISLTIKWLLSVSILISNHDTSRSFLTLSSLFRRAANHIQRCRRGKRLATFQSKSRFIRMRMDDRSRKTSKLKIPSSKISIFRRTIKSSQVKHTVQTQSFQNYIVDGDQVPVGVVDVERSREQLTPLGQQATSSENGGDSGIVETQTRTMTYEAQGGENAAPPGWAEQVRHLYDHLILNCETFRDLASTSLLRA